MRRVPVESSLTKRFANGPEAEERDDLVGVGPLGPFDPRAFGSPSAIAGEAGVLLGLERELARSRAR